MKKANRLYPFVTGLVFPVCSENDVRRHHYPSRSAALIREGSLRMGIARGHASEFSQTRKFMRTTNLSNPGKSGLKAFAYPTALAA